MTSSQVGNQIIVLPTKRTCQLIILPTNRTCELIIPTYQQDIHVYYPTYQQDLHAYYPTCKQDIWTHCPTHQKDPTCLFFFLPTGPTHFYLQDLPCAENRLPGWNPTSTQFGGTKDCIAKSQIVKKKKKRVRRRSGERKALGLLRGISSGAISRCFLHWLFRIIV
jgi:hypothetical protein